MFGYYVCFFSLANTVEIIILRTSLYDNGGNKWNEMFIYKMFLLLVLSLLARAQRACERTNNKKRLGYTYMRINIRLQPLLVETGQPIFSLLCAAACMNLLTVLPYFSK